MTSPSPGSTPLAQLIVLARWVLIAIVIVASWEAVSFLAGVLAPILTALLMAYLLNPVLERMVKRGVNRSAAALLLLVSFLLLVVGALAFVAPRVVDQLQAFATGLPRMVDNLSLWTTTHFNVALPKDWSKVVASTNVRESLGDASGPLRDLATAALGGVFSLLGALAEFLLVPVFAFYFLSDFPSLVRRVEHMIPPRSRSTVREIVREIDRVVAGWVRGQAIVTAILAVLYATLFTLVGMPLSLPIGLLVALLTVIPFIGTFVGASIALLVTLADGGDASTMLSVAGVILVLHLLEAGVLTPKIVGHRVGLSESGALFAVVALGKLLGFVGIILAVPIAATCAVLVRYAVRYYEHTAFFGHESDADIVITPAMAMIMPGVASMRDVHMTAGDTGAIIAHATTRGRARARPRERRLGRAVDRRLGARARARRRGRAGEARPRRRGMSTEHPEDLRVDDRDGVRTLTIDRAGSRNALTVDLVARLAAAVADAPATARVIVLAGAHGAFCSGLDLKAAMARGMVPPAEREADLRGKFHALIRALIDCDRPTIAAVDGAAAGFGCDLALACDLRIASERAVFGEIFVRRGLMPDGGGTWLLPHIIGLGRALELLLTGDPVDAADALRIGLANRVVPIAEHAAAVAELAARLAKGPPLVHRLVKRSVYAGLDGNLTAALDREAVGQMQLLASRDFIEGVTAFLQKREPAFTGE